MGKWAKYLPLCVGICVSRVFILRADGGLHAKIKHAPKRKKEKQSINRKSTKVPCSSSFLVNDIACLRFSPLHLPISAFCSFSNATKHQAQQLSAMMIIKPKDASNAIG